MAVRGRGNLGACCTVFANHPSELHRLEEARWPVKAGHLQVGGADARRIVRVGPCASRQSPSPGEVCRSVIQFLVSDLGVEHLHDVRHAVGAKTVGGRAQAATDQIERVRQVHQAALRPDPGDHLGDGQHVGDPLGQEQPDDLPGLRPDLLADDHPHRSVPGGRRFDRSPGLVMVGDADHVDPLGHCALSELVESRDGIARRHGVQVAVDPHPPWTHHIISRSPRDQSALERLQRSAGAIFDPRA